MLRSSPLARLLHKPMDRKTFLKTVALGVAIVGGASGLLQLLGHGKPTTRPTYGSSAYGPKS